MTSSAKLVWLYLAAQAGSDRKVKGVSLTTMCSSLQMSHRAVIDAIRALVDAGYVERIRLGRYHEPTMYRVVEQPTFLKKVA